jgi:hypothetical protein
MQTKFKIGDENMNKEKKKIVINGRIICRIISIIGVLVILICAVIVGIRDSAPFALFASNPLSLLTGVVALCFVGYYGWSNVNSNKK